MNTTFDVLVIVLSCLLGLFLILSIVIAVLVLKVVSAIRKIVAKGEHVVENAEAAAEMFKKAAGPLGAFKAITNIIEVVAKHKRGKE